ncbi:hypothetical protein FRX31_021535 [Thalictrum thalictroides]|uniref:Transmembrane protein n=1 Tax=Thalictrum thalictroides TaxID=46969 RepID=A0A7J6VW90_THATH|nr:hypothetical protein FRX31_021535 [Thalictrum thalictroides]
MEGKLHSDSNFLLFDNVDAFLRLLYIAFASSKTSKMGEGGEELMELNHISIRIREDIHVSNDNDELLQRIKEKIHPIPSSQCCIYRIPECLRILSEEAYVPKIVSLGPFHRDKEGLKAMEEHKKWYLHALLFRTSTPDKCLEDFLTAIQAMEIQIRASYGEPVNLSSDEFVEMILLDSCFVIELLYNYGRVDLRDDNDPIYIASWMLSSLKHDIILLENQLPFFVLNRLFDMIRDPNNGDLLLDEYVQYFFRDVLPPVELYKGRFRRQTNHLLDFLRNHFFQFTKQNEEAEYSYEDQRRQIEEAEYTYEEQRIECATELSNAGVKFEAAHIADSLLDISFSGNGVFEIPLFFLDDTVSSLLGNLIALEQCDNDYASYVSSYIILLDSLVMSPKDVRLLRAEGIIDSFFGDDEHIFHIIKKLSKGTVVSKFYFAGLSHQVNAYYHSGWHKWRANLTRNYVNTLKRDYFNTPWGIFSFVAATVLLLLTFVQTLFTILN